MDHVCRDIGLELGVANKYNNGVNVLRSERKERLYGFGMFVVLSQWIHKTVLFLEHDLGPLLRLGVAKNPPGVILGLNHENSVFGDNDVVDLRRPMRRRQCDVVKDLVFVRR